MKDRVATTTVSRYWTVPGLLDRQLVALDVGGTVLGGLASSRFDKVLVRDEQLAVSASANMYALQRVGIFYVEAAVKPGVDPALVEKRLDELVAQYIAEGPTEAEVQRAALREVGGRIRGLEQVGGFGGKAVTLAEGQTYRRRQRFLQEDARDLCRGHPGRSAGGDAPVADPPGAVGAARAGRAPALCRDQVHPRRQGQADHHRGDPGRQAPGARGRPAHRARLPDHHPHHLANGLAVDYAQRTAVPITQLAVSFNAGEAADTPTARGVQSLMLGMLEEGTTSLDAQAYSEAKERLGVEIDTSSSLDRSTVTMSALSANLAPSLAWSAT
jgi:zinc protease